MTPEDYSNYYPIELAIGNDPATTYLLSDQLCGRAVDGSSLDHENLGESSLVYIDGGKLYKLDKLNLSRNLFGCLPVYTNASENCIATGQLYIRLTPGQDFSAFEPNLNKLGYICVSVPAYAKHTAWVIRQDRDIGLGLRGLKNLKAQLNPVHIEAQLLRPSQTK